MAAVVKGSGLNHPAMQAMFNNFAANEKKHDAFVELLSELYVKAHLAGLQEAHVVPLAEKVEDIKLAIWTEKNPYADKDDAPKPRRADMTVLRRVVKASYMKSADFWSALLACTQSPGTIGDVCEAAVKLWKASKNVPHAKMVARLAKEATAAKRGGGGNAKWKASQRITVMQDHAKALGAKNFEAVAGAQLAQIVRALDTMMDRAIVIEAKAKAAKDEAAAAKKAKAAKKKK